MARTSGCQDRGSYRKALSVPHRRYVYDGVLESQMVMVFDAHKRLLGVTDVYPAPLEVKKGDLVLRARLRHDDASLLHRLRHLPLVRRYSGTDVRMCRA